MPQRFGLVASKGVLAPRMVTWSGAVSDRLAGAAGVITAFVLLGVAIRRARRTRDASRRRLLAIGIASSVAIGLLAVLDTLATLLPLLAIAGGVHLGVLALARGRDGDGNGDGNEIASAARSFGIVLGTFVLVTALWLPLDWARYYLPIIALMPVAYVWGVAELLDLPGGGRDVPAAT